MYCKFIKYVEIKCMIDIKKKKELMLLSSNIGEDSWESLGQQGDPTSPP